MMTYVGKKRGPARIEESKKSLAHLPARVLLSEKERFKKLGDRKIQDHIRRVVKICFKIELLKAEKAQAQSQNIPFDAERFEQEYQEHAKEQERALEQVFGSYHQ